MNYRSKLGKRNYYKKSYWGVRFAPTGKFISKDRHIDFSELNFEYNWHDLASLWKSPTVLNVTIRGATPRNYKIEDIEV